MSEEKKELEIANKDEVIMALVKDLVELAIDTQKLLLDCTVPLKLVKHAELLLHTTNQILNDYTKEEEKKSE